MSGEPVLSVVTISFRDLEGLRSTVASVAQQSYPAIEHIVVDGGSGDAVAQFLGTLAPAYWQSQPDAGRYDAMNQGIARATGDVVWLMHSGDCFAGTEAAAAGMAGLAAAGNVRDSWGYGKVRIVGDPAREGIVWGYSPFEMKKFALGIRPIPHQGALFGADLLGRLGPYDTEFGLAADHLYMLAAARLRAPVVIDEILCDFDASGAGSVRPQSEHYDDVRRAWDVAGYYPFRRRALSAAYSRLLELSARSKQLVRERVGAGQ